MRSTTGLPIDFQWGRLLKQTAGAVQTATECTDFAYFTNTFFAEIRAPAFELCPGILETRFFSNAGSPGYAYGPGLLEVSHGPDEYVKIRRVADCAKIYALTALRLLS